MDSDLFQVLFSFYCSQLKLKGMQKHRVSHEFHGKITRVAA